MCKFQMFPNVATAKGLGEGKEQGLQKLFNTIQEHFLIYWIEDCVAHKAQRSKNSDSQVGISLVCPYQHVTQSLHRRHKAQF